MSDVICQYCGNPAELVDSAIIYGKSYGMIWLCEPCNAYVGVHKYSKKYAPLGVLANPELREAKKDAHKIFDPLWQRKMERDKCSKAEARKLAYAWLAGKMGLTIQKCHIGMFSVEECNKVVEICKPFVLGVKK